MTDSSQPQRPVFRIPTDFKIETLPILDPVDVEMIDSATQGIRLRGATLAELGYESEPAVDEDQGDERQAA